MTRRDTCCRSSPNRLRIARPCFTRSSNAKAARASERAILKPCLKPSSTSRRCAVIWYEKEPGDRGAEPQRQEDTLAAATLALCGQTLIFMWSENLRYQTGFGNEFATEAIAGALPAGQNSPQKAPFGLYAEQLSGSPFTAPRATNRRSWLYRIRPSVLHKPFRQIDQGRIRTAPLSAKSLTPNQLRWDPLPLPGKPTDFVAGLITMGGNGDAGAAVGAGIHIYAATAPMRDRFFYNADGEMLIVPEQGRL